MDKNKDPAFLFYSSDFLIGVCDLTMEERGEYITLICLQHQKGHLSDKTIRLALGNVSVDVLSKFNRDEDGLLFNVRVEEEILKRMNFVDSRRENGIKGGRPKTTSITTRLPDRLSLGEPKNNHSEDENENENKDVNDDNSYNDIVNSFNQICVSLPKIKSLTNSRKSKLKARWNEIKSLKEFESLFYKVEQSDFLSGRSGDWKCSFDWLMVNDTNYCKVLEGQYNNHKEKTNYNSNFQGKNNSYKKSGNPFKDLLQEEMEKENEQKRNNSNNDCDKNSIPLLLQG